MEYLLLTLFAIITLALLGLVIAISPTLVITELAILTKSKNAFRHTVAFISGIALAVTLFLTVTILFADPNRQYNIPSTREIIGSVPLIDVLAGTILIILAIKLAKTLYLPKKESRFTSDKFLKSKTLFWFGFIKMATSLSSLAAILLASRLIKTYLSNDAQQTAAVLYLLLVAILPFIILAFIERLRPDLFQYIQRSSQRVSSLNWRKYIMIGAFSVGVVLIISGILHHENSILLK